MKNKVKNIVEYQPERQRTPQEAIDFLQEMVNQGYAEKIIILFNNDTTSGSIFASPDRNFKNNEILWEMTQYIHKELII